MLNFAHNHQYNFKYIMLLMSEENKGRCFAKVLKRISGTDTIKEKALLELAGFLFKYIRNSKCREFLYKNKLIKKYIDMKMWNWYHMNMKTVKNKKRGISYERTNSSKRNFGTHWWQRKC